MLPINTFREPRVDWSFTQPKVDVLDTLRDWNPERFYEEFEGYVDNFSYNLIYEYPKGTDYDMAVVFYQDEPTKGHRSIHVVDCPGSSLKVPVCGYDYFPCTNRMTQEMFYNLIISADIPETKRLFTLRYMLEALIKEKSENPLSFGVDPDKNKKLLREVFEKRPGLEEFYEMLIETVSRAVETESRRAIIENYIPLPLNIRLDDVVKLELFRGPIN